MLKAKRFRFGAKAFKRDTSVIARPRLPESVVRELWIDPEIFSGKYSEPYRQAARNHNRLMKWAIGKSNNELIDAVGRLAWQLSYARTSKSETSKWVDTFRSSAIDSRKKLAAKTDERRKGGANKDANSRFPAAREEMMRLWTLGEKQGWAATMYQAQLAARGHKVALRTVSNWLEALRAGKPPTHRKNAPASRR